MLDGAVHNCTTLPADDSALVFERAKDERAVAPHPRMGAALPKPGSCWYRTLPTSLPPRSAHARRGTRAVFVRYDGESSELVQHVERHHGRLSTSIVEPPLAFTDPRRPPQGVIHTCVH